MRNILSFGADAQEIALAPLNVLIGPNASGKSNLIEILGLLTHVRSGFWPALHGRGGAREWLWRDEGTLAKEGVTAEVEVALTGETTPLLRYCVAFDSQGIQSEELSSAGPDKAGLEASPYLRRSDGMAELFVKDSASAETSRVVRTLPLAGQETVAGQFRDPVTFPELEQFEKALSGIRLYREWSFGRNNALRAPQKPDYPSSCLLEGGENLGLVLTRLAGDAHAKKQLVGGLARLYEGVTDYYVAIEYGTVQVYICEGERRVSAARLSDGALRYLSLLAVLCHPEPPWLVCLEEPELGLHPDVLPGLADLLREASERCQLIVTTHSEVLVDALTDSPESVVVCERPEGQTTLKRLDKDELAFWLDRYRLGELWGTGQFGGNRW